MEIDQLVDAACERAGSTDFGVETWQEGLRVLIAALDEEAGLNDMGAAAMADQTGSTPPATSAARSASAGSARTSSTSCPAPAS